MDRRTFITTLLSFSMMSCQGQSSTGSAIARQPQGSITPVNQSVPSTEEIMAWIREIVSLGERRPGDLGDQRMEEYVQNQFRLLGLENIRLQDVPNTIRWDPGNPALVVTGSATSITVPCFPFARQAFNSTVSGDVVAFDNSMLDQNLSSKIVLFDYPLSEGEQAAVARRATWVYDPDGTINESAHIVPLTQNSPVAGQINALIAQNPTAILAVLSNYFDSHQIFGRQTGGRDRNTPDNVPIVWISPRSGQEIRQRLQQGSLQAQLTLNSSLSEVTTHNVMGELPGATDELVVIASHHDAPFASAVEDGSGVALVLAQAHYWSQIPVDQRPHRMLFLTTAAHFSGVAGTITFVQDQALMDRIVLEIHLEHAATEYAIRDQQLVNLNRTEPRWLFTACVPQLQEAVREAITTEDVRRTLMLEPRFFGRFPASDGGPFYTKGVPLVNHVTIPVYLTDAQDTLDKVDQALLVPLTRAAIRIVNSTASQTAGSMRRSNNRRCPPLQ